MPPCPVNSPTSGPATCVEGGVPRASYLDELHASRVTYSRCKQSKSLSLRFPWNHSIEWMKKSKRSPRIFWTLGPKPTTQLLICSEACSLGIRMCIGV